MPEERTARSTPVTLSSNSNSKINSENINLFVPRSAKSINLTNAFFIANVINRNISVELSQMHCSVPVYKRAITAWLLAAGSEHAEALLTTVYNS